MKPERRLVKPIDSSLSPSLERPLSSPMLATVTMHERPVKPSAEAKMPKWCADLSVSVPGQAGFKQIIFNYLRV